MSEKAKKIYDNFMMKLSKRNSISYWLVDIKDDNKTPKVVIQKHGELLSRWKAYIFDNGHVLCEYYRVRKECVAMAEFKLANYLAKGESSDE